MGRTEVYEGGSRASVGTKPAPEMEPAQEWWARSSLYFILGRDWLQNRNVCYLALRFNDVSASLVSVKRGRKNQDFS